MTDRSPGPPTSSPGAPGEDAFFSSTPKAERWTAEEVAALWQRRRAGHLLLALGGTCALMALLLWFLRDAVAGGSPAAINIQIWTTLGFAPLHVGLWWWSGRRPLLAVIASATAFVGLELWLLVVDPYGLARGIYLKLAIALLLYRAFRAARAGQVLPPPPPER